MDMGEFVKTDIEICPVLNGGYVVRRVPFRFDAPSKSETMAFSNYKDLLAFLNSDYAMANMGASSGNPSSAKSVSPNINQE